MKYAELLLSPEWQHKRCQILRRDNYQCQRCSNENFLSDCDKGVIAGGSEDRFFQPEEYGLNYSVKIFIPNQLQFNFMRALISKQGFEVGYNSIAYFIQNKESGQVNIIAIRKIKPGQVTELFDNRDTTLPYDKQVFFPFTDYILDELANNYWSKYKWMPFQGLHVHHNYYLSEKKPWEYGDDALTTLCPTCHEELHKDGKTGIHDNNGNVIGLLTNCFRCHGAGWFPEFHHVQEGICFRCNGAKYEELIV
ncbi:hypothetical protein HXX01_03230 [Candidatus Nomurabacteria bacterium]|nr:hypothetical protein [Candidatus Nomurabacteria bacterium]